MSPSQSALLFELQQLLSEMHAAQEAFSGAQVRATALISELSEAGATESPRDSEEDPFDLNPDFEKLLEEEFSRAAGRSDHYVEAAFADPFDCFDDSAPENGFPFQDRFKESTGALKGLFESDPQRGIAKPPAAPDVEIEYLPNGGYRMRSIPANPGNGRQSSTDDELSQDSTSLDGLSS